ncbi:hypothetical protein Tco_0857701 [Tanacetum coccineum]|uniref:Uncharacterized protein n=1 Tax=Tanacetum coccineum TaxID=301880 RepID=A0ABQ5BCP2_9ASTR
MTAFKVLETQFQTFIKSQIYLDDEYVIMTCKYFIEYTQLEIREFRDTLIQHMEYVKKSIDKRALHKRDLVDTESSGIEFEKQDTSSRPGNDADADNADIKPVYDEEPMAEVQLTAECNVFATRQQHSEQPKFNNEGEVDQNTEQCHDTRPLPAKLSNNQITELLYQSIEYKNICLKKTVAQFQNEFLRMEAHCVNLELKYQNQALKEGQHGQFSKVKSNEDKVTHDIDVIETINIDLKHKVAKLLKENETLKRHCKELSDSIKTTRAKTIEHKTSLIAQNAEFKAQLQEKGFAIAALKNELRKLKGNSVNTKFAKSSILGKLILQSLINQLVVRKPTAFKSERPRISKPRFAFQVDVNNNFLKPVTTQYLPKEREYAAVEPHHMIASSESRNSLKNMPRFSSNDMVHNHYLEEAKKKTYKIGRNSRPSVMPSARSQSTVNGSKPKPMINNKNSRNWPASKSSCVTTKTVPIVEQSRNSRNFFDSKHFVCSTCQKCVFNANHDHCVTKFLNEVNSRVKVPSNKTTNRNKPVEQISIVKKPERQIPKGHRWVSIRKIFTSSITMVDSEPPHGSNTDITNLHECIQTLDSSAGTNDGVAALFQHSLIHYHILMLKLQRNTISIKIQESRKQELKTKTSANSDIKDPSLKNQASGEIVRELSRRCKSKDNDKGSRSKITQHEGTSLQQDKDQDKDSRTQRQSNLNKSKEA